jgi:hypothetical protein
MTVTVSLTDSAVFTALGNFLVNVLPPQCEVLQAQDNRVPEPSLPDFVTMTMLRRPRLATNVDTPEDAKFTGSIAGSVMTITEVVSGVMNIGATVFGVGVAANTQVTAQISGSPLGGVGSYAVSQPQTLGPITLSAGQIQVEQSTEVVTQLDVHGPDSGNNSQIVSTLFRDSYGVEFFKANSPGITPLYCDDPKQIPFFDAEQQYESRWIIDVHMQIDPSLSVPIEFADSADVTVVSVTEVFPAA